MKLNLKDMWRGAVMWLSGLLSGLVVTFGAGLLAISLAGASVLENPMAIFSLGGIAIIYIIVMIPVSWWLRAIIYDFIARISKLEK